MTYFALAGIVFCAVLGLIVLGLIVYCLVLLIAGLCD